MFQYQSTVKLHDTDAAGVLFFANQFKLAHDAYEAFLNEIGFPIQSFFSKHNYFLPIVHAEADFSAPLRVGDKLTIRVEVEKTGTSSFTLLYRLFNESQTEVGLTRTVHVSLEAKSGKKIALPDDLRSALGSHQL